MIGHRHPNPGFIPEGKVNENVKYDMSNIKHLFTYNKKTQ